MNLSIKKDSLIYNEHDGCHSVYVIKSGAVKLRKIIVIDLSYYWPINNSQWKVKCQSKKVSIAYRNVTQGEFFGEKDLVLERKRTH